MTLPFSPLRDQPHYIYRTDIQAPDLLARAERLYPGIMAYGHVGTSRKWFRLTKDGNEYGKFDYYRIFVPVNCAWLFEDFIGEYFNPQVEHAINVENIFAWPSDDPEALDQMAEYGRAIARQLVEAGDLREHVPDFLTDYQARAVYWGATRPFLKLVYPCGCLSGDTELVVNRCGRARRMRLRDLVYKHNGGASRGRTWSDAPTRTQSVDDDGYRKLNDVVHAVSTGEKEVFLLTTECGRSIKATADHRFSTPDGWRLLRSLRPGDLVSVVRSGGREPWPKEERTARAPKAYYARVGMLGIENHPFCVEWFCDRDKRWNATAYVHRLVAEARLNDLSYDEFLGRVLEGDLDGLEFLDPKVWHVHHKDHDSTNNDPDNLEVLTAEAHQEKHGDWKKCSPRARFVEVVSIESAGVEETFDLSMALPHDNFVANEFVVHNSGKTLAAIVSALFRKGPIAVIAPAKARRVWWDQVQEYTYLRPHRVIPEGQRRRDDIDVEQYLEREREAGRRPVVIFGSQSLPDYMHELMRVHPVSLIYDELHGFGQPKRWTAEYDASGEVVFHKRKTTTNTRETRAVAAMDASRMSSVQFRCGLTATPLDDGRPRRVWAQLDLLSPGGFSMGYSAFAKRYCDAREGEYGGLEDKGSSNIAELKARAAFLMQEVSHTESHGELPPTRVQVVWLDPSDQNRPAAFRRIINAAEKKAAKTHSVFDRERALEANLAEAASRKRKYSIEEVLDGMRGGGKVVLFTARRKDCEDWAAQIEKAVRREVKKGLYGGTMPDLWWGHGDTPDRERESMVESFRDNEGPCCLIGTGQAFGESIDGLQCADLALFVMLPWRPGDFIQWKGRFDRLGGRPTLLKVILARGTYDEVMAGKLADKTIPIVEYLKAEEYQGLGSKLVGTDDKEAMRASIINSLFGGEE